MDSIVKRLMENHRVPKRRIDEKAVWKITWQLNGIEHVYEFPAKDWREAERFTDKKVIPDRNMDPKGYEHFTNSMRHDPEYYKILDIEQVGGDPVRSNTPNPYDKQNGRE